MDNPLNILEQQTVVRIYHSVSLVQGCTSNEGPTVDVTTFKTIKITGEMNCENVISLLAQKLAINDSAKYNLYSLDSQLGNGKFNK